MRLQDVFVFAERGQVALNAEAPSIPERVNDAGGSSAEETGDVVSL